MTLRQARRYRDAARSDGAADEAHQRAGGEIAGEPAAAGHQRRVFQPADGAADPFHSGAGGCACHGGLNSAYPLVPAKAGTQRFPASPAGYSAIPACAGMSGELHRLDRIGA